MGEDGARKNVHFAKVYGVDGRHDYIYVTNSEADNGDVTYDFNVWRNDGGGGTMVKGKLLRLLMSSVMLWFLMCLP